MTLTEDEAKTKECCGAPALVRAILGHAMAINGLDPETLPPALKEQIKTTNCIASQCMAWRIAEKGWAAELTDRSTRERRLIEAGTRPKTLEKRGAYEWVVVHDLGFCGLAGKP